MSKRTAADYMLSTRRNGLKKFLFNEFGMSSSGLDLYSASSLFTETTVHMHFNMAHIGTSSNTDLVVTSKDILCSYLPSQRSREARLIYCYPTISQLLY